MQAHIQRRVCGNPPAPVPAGAKRAQIDWGNLIRASCLFVCFPSSNKTVHICSEFWLKCLGYLALSLDGVCGEKIITFRSWRFPVGPHGLRMMETRFLLLFCL